jgi:hypothetical protein
MRVTSTALECGCGRVATAVVLAVAALLCGGAASAWAGPGVTLKQGANSPTKLISGGQIAGSADSSGTYTVREGPGDPGKQVSLSGLSIRGLLRLAGYNPGAVRFVQVVGGDGSVITVTATEINSPPSPPPIVSDDGTTTRFVKAGGQSVESVPGTPLEMAVEGGSLLSVRASAAPATVKVGQTVTFRASVRFAPAGASYSYTWDFNDGEIGAGATVTHRYKLSGNLIPRVTVRGTGGSTAQCSSVCEGTATVEVTVTGSEREGELGTPEGGGDGSGLGGSGTGGTGSGTGSGGDGTDLSAFGGYKPKPQPKPRPERAERPEPHEPFSSDPDSGEGKVVVQGVLLAGAGRTIEGPLSKGAPAGNPKPQKGTPGIASEPSRISAALAVALGFMTMGALRERRRVRLRVA